MGTIKQIFSRNISFYVSKSNPLQISRFRSTFPSLSSSNYRRLFSSEVSSKSSDSNLGQSHNSDDAEKFSNQELKQQIEKFYDGDQEAFASVFEAILRRKLSGKTEEMDEELIKELPNHPRVHHGEDSDDKEFDSD